MLLTTLSFGETDTLSIFCVVRRYIVQLRMCQALGEIRLLKHKLQPAGAKMVSGLQVVIPPF